MLFGASGVYLWQTWFTSSPLRSFHFRSDNNHWLQMDKFGHAYSAYAIATYFTAELEWMGLSKEKSERWGTGISLFTTSSIDIMDGFSSKWGASWGDLIANTSWSMLFLGQELLWGEQRIDYKFSYWPTPFPDYSNELGTGFVSEILQDYNGQTYWLSFNLNSFTPNREIPKWLNIAIGYGAHNMVKRDGNPVMSDFGEKLPDYNRMRQFYVSPDISFRRIPSKHAFVRTLFFLMDFIKLPLPALAYQSDGKFVFYGLHY